MRIIFDAAAVGESHRRLDDNGFLHVTACPITSFGTFDYARSEAELPGDPNEIVKVLRAKEVITSAEFIASCQKLPIVDDHTYIEGVTVDGELGEDDAGMDPDKKGVCGIMSDFRFDEASGWCVADLVFYSRSMIRMILADKKVELSLGYTCKFIPLEGQEQAAEQVNMSGNHLALVGRARVPGARVLDSAFTHPSENDDMTAKEKAALAAKKAKALKTGDAAIDALREALLPALQAYLETAGGGEVTEPTPEEAAAAAASAEEQAGAETAVNPEDKVEGEEVADEADPITALLQQLVAALSGTAATGDEETSEEKKAGDEETDNGEVKADVKATGDEEGEEQVAAKEKGAVTMDAMFAAVAKRDALYGRVSRLVGTFDHAAMSHDKVAKYGVKKLGIKCADGHEIAALDAYLLASDKHAASVVTTQAKTKTVGDSMPSSDELDAFLAGKKE